MAITITHLNDVACKYANFNLLAFAEKAEVAVFSFNAAGTATHVSGPINSKVVELIATRGGLGEAIKGGYVEPSEAHGQHVFMFNEALVAGVEATDMVLLHEVCHMLDLNEGLFKDDLRLTEHDKELGKEFEARALKEADGNGQWGDVYHNQRFGAIVSYCIRTHAHRKYKELVRLAFTHTVPDWGGEVSDCKWLQLGQDALVIEEIDDRHYVGWVQGQKVCELDLFEDDQGRYWLNHITTSECFQRKGIGLAMLERAVFYKEAIYAAENMSSSDDPDDTRHLSSEGAALVNAAKRKNVLRKEWCFDPNMESEF